jgi:hypothetical protein
LRTPIMTDVICREGTSNLTATRTLLYGTLKLIWDPTPQTAFPKPSLQEKQRKTTKKNPAATSCQPTPKNLPFSKRSLTDSEPNALFKTFFLMEKNCPEKWVGKP